LKSFNVFKVALIVGLILSCNDTKPAEAQSPSNLHLVDSLEINRYVSLKKIQDTSSGQIRTCYVTINTEWTNTASAVSCL
jgi:hypothetical protein